MILCILNIARSCCRRRGEVGGEGFFRLSAFGRREQVEEAYDLRGGCGFTDGNGCSTGISKGSLFGGSKKPLKMPTEVM